MRGHGSLVLPRLLRPHPIAAAREVPRDDREEGERAAAAHTCRRALVDEDARTHGHALPTQRRVPVAIILGLLVLLLAVVVALFFFVVVVLLLLLVLLAAARRLRTWWCFRSGGREAA